MFLAKNGALLRPGKLTGTFLVGYGVSRYLIEFYRVPDPQFFSALNPNGYAVFFGEFGVTMGQFLCLPMIFLGLAFYFMDLNKVKVPK